MWRFARCYILSTCVDVDATVTASRTATAMDMSPPTVTATTTELMSCDRRRSRSPFYMRDDMLATLALLRCTGPGVRGPRIAVRDPPNLVVLLTRCGQLIPRKTSKFDATRCQILRLNAQSSISAAWAPPPTPLGELTALFQTP